MNEYVLCYAKNIKKAPMLSLEDTKKQKAKPVGFIKTLLKSVSYEKKEAIILDFFAGSGTTAHAVMELNKEDEGKRKYILVQSNEKIKKSSKNFQNRYANVYEITKDRIDFAIMKNDFKNGGYTEIVV